MAKEETALVEVPVAGELATSLEDMFVADAGMGMHGVGASDVSIPFITILQKGSPQVSRANAKFIKGAAAGMIMNTVTQQVFPGESEGDIPGGILWIPCGFKKILVRWKSREAAGGGLVGHYQENDPALKQFKRDERGRLFDPETKDIIVDTAYHYGMMLGEGFPEFAVISMYSTQLKKSRSWNTTMKRIIKKAPNGQMYNPPSYAYVYRLTTIGEAKDSYDWFGWQIVSEGEVRDVEIYKLAREFSSQVEAGKVAVSAPPRDDFEESGAPSSDGVPF